MNASFASLLILLSSWILRGEAVRILRLDTVTVSAFLHGLLAQGRLNDELLFLYSGELWREFVVDSLLDNGTDTMNQYNDRITVVGRSQLFASFMVVSFLVLSFVL